MTIHPSLAERVLGISPPFQDTAAMLAQAYTTLTGEQADVERLIDQNTSINETVASQRVTIGLPRALYQLEPDTLEKSVVLNTLRHTFKEGDAPYGSILGTLPLYQAMYAEHVAPYESEAPGRKALLVGSLNPASSAAFVALSECILHAEPWAVDPRAGRYTRRHGKFVEANGLALPAEWAGSMYAVVTNRLLHMLVDTDGQLATRTEASEQSTNRQFAREMFRVLQAGGHLLLCEQPPGVELPQDLECTGVRNRTAIADFDTSIRTILDDTGFSNIHITSGWETGSSDFLFQPFDPDRPFAPGVERPFMRAIYAQKPAG